MKATTADWYKKHGRHTVYANCRPLQLDSYAHDLVVDMADANRVRKRSSGPQSAHEEIVLQRLCEKASEAKKEDELVQIQ